MFDNFQIGHTYTFNYNGKPRSVVIEKVAPQLVTGWDQSVEGYRSFSKWKIEGVVIEWVKNQNGNVVNVL